MVNHSVISTYIVRQPRSMDVVWEFECSWSLNERTL